MGVMMGQGVNVNLYRIIKGHLPGKIYLSILYAYLLESLLTWIVQQPKPQNWL